MMLPVNYQLSAFGNFSMSPTPTSIIALMQGFNKATGIDFLPNIINSQQVELPANKITTISNLGFITNDQQLSVVVLNERIDVTYTRVQSEIAVDTFFKSAEKILSVLLNYFSVKSNRLATNIEYIVPCDVHNQNELCRKMLNPLSNFSEKHVLEWSYRTNFLSSLKIRDVEEKLNTITSISTAVDQKNSPVIVCHIDINTMPLQTELRFYSDDLGNFVDGTLGIANQIKDDMEALVLSDKE